jgi:hypothetical protein
VNRYAASLNLSEPERTWKDSCVASTGLKTTALVL